jgi:NADH dehydrogenase
VIPVFGAGTNQFQPVAVETVAKAFVGALTADVAINRIYDLAGAQVLTMDQVYDAILRTTGRRRPRIPLPLALARLQAVVMESGYALIGSPSPLTRDQLLMLQEDNVGDPTAAQQDFGLELQSFTEGIARYL